MGPGRISTGRDGPGRPPSDVRRAAAVFRHRHGGTPSRLSREAVTRRRTPPRRHGGSGCVGASLTGTKNGVVQVRWCADPSCSCARFCSAARSARDQRCSKFRPTVGLPDRMIEGLTVARQPS
ncbi:predicted protein [Streptomyces viridosporus ATCC 14672]|uniref:Predicted protein n=1 Tax=Streptomyces viridosporus (strain ATCC 14672 / DSM 40746 / JCM 4963 / KCTC 9882 / NRRL B-12104 / FH 1290) TaxID=566461 RepID=D6A1G5_STRV1|nr:predicted protein [Streptomyces viridosporus ATCC 14672]